MIPVLTPEEMGGVDAAAPEPVEVLVGRAGQAVALAAGRLLGGCYGRRVVVVAGPGNNGADGRAAARLLARRGAAVAVLDAAAVPGGGRLPACDLVIDAAYGTGLRRPYDPPDPGGTPVLAVDIPSGLSGLSGRPVQASGAGGAVRARCTVTFASYKPGLLLGEGPERAGEVQLADIGLGPLAAAAARTWLVGDEDVALVPRRPREAHKWQAAVAVVAGSAAMTGAAWLVSQGALHAGAGYVRLGVPGLGGDGGLPPGEVVRQELPAAGWDGPAAAGLERFASLVVGPGLGPAGRGPAGATGLGTPVAGLLAAARTPAVVDADGLNALGDLATLAAVARQRPAPTVITPHAGEYARLVGAPPGPDPVASVREVAAASGAVVLLKGSTTVVGSPDGRVLVSAAGSARLATAGTGDVLSGVIGALLARRVPALEAAALGAHIHGRAAALGPAEGLVASDLPGLVARWLSGARGSRA